MQNLATKIFIAYGIVMSISPGGPNGRIFERLCRTHRGLQTTDFWRSGTRPCGMKIIFEKSHSGMVKASLHPRFMVKTGAPE